MKHPDVSTCTLTLFSAPRIIAAGNDAPSRAAAPQGSVVVVAAAAAAQVARRRLVTEIRDNVA